MTNLFAQDFYDNALNQKLTGYIVELITDKAFLYLWRWLLISNRYCCSILFCMTAQRL